MGCREECVLFYCSGIIAQLISRSCTARIIIKFRFTTALGMQHTYTLGSWGLCGFNIKRSCRSELLTDGRDYPSETTVFLAPHTWQVACVSDIEQVGQLNAWPCQHSEHVLCNYVSFLQEIDRPTYCHDRVNLAPQLRAQEKDQVILLPNWYAQVRLQEYIAIKVEVVLRTNEQ